MHTSGLFLCRPGQAARFSTETPIPSIDRTRSGSAGLVFILIWAKPATPPRAADVKLQAAMNTRSAVTRSSKLSRWLDSKIDGTEIPSSKRARMSAGCLDQAMEHQKAIVLLVRRQHHGSALSLVRLAFESYVRGVWLHHCATETELNEYTRDKLRKEFSVLIKEFEVVEAFTAGTLSAIKKRSWPTMNSFTHSGYNQAVRRNKIDSIEPNYGEQEVLEALQFSNTIALLASIQIASLANNVELANACLKKAKRLLPIAT